MNYLSLKRRCELEDQISLQIFNDNNVRSHFDYQTIEIEAGRFSKILTLVTSNPSHKELFTLYTTSSHHSEIECLDEVLLYLDEIKKPQTGHFNYKVEWFRSNEPDQKFTSYFTGKNYLEIIQKFFKNKNPNDFVIVSTSIQPIA